MISRLGLNGVTALAVMLTLDSVYADSLFRSVRVGSGQTVRVGVFGHVKADCTAGRPLEVKVVAPPQNGVLAVRAGTMKLGAARQCANAEIPVNGVFYQARAGFAGDDEVTFEVTEPSNRVVRHVVKIVVGPQLTTPRAEPRSL